METFLNYPPRLILFCLQFWDEYFSKMAAEGPITIEGYVDGHKKYGKEGFRKLIDMFYSIFFDSVDLDNKGFINLEEFTIYFSVIMGMDSKMAAETFEVIDTNGDGKMTREEYLAAADDFFISEGENSPYSVFWGPLL